MSFLLIDKPKGITSHDVVDRIREITGEKRVGHSGTLDPLATGLLVIGVERGSTKKLGQISGRDKTYEAELILGEERETLDAEGSMTSVYNGQKPTFQKIKQALRYFEGEYEQLPPKFSAIKIKGKKAYELARMGKKVTLKPRKVKIYKIGFISYEYPSLKIETTVSSGTYVRSLARDIGKYLGTGAFLNNLRRISIGKYKLESSTSLDKLKKNNWKDFVVELIK